MTETKSYIFTVQPHERDNRLDKFLVEKLPEYSRNFFQNIISEKQVLLNGKPETKNRVLLKEGDVVELIFASEDHCSDYQLLPEAIPLDIIYEDDMILVINKPRGLVVHPAAGHRSGTLANALLFHCEELNRDCNRDPIRPGIIHRLDKDTSGLLIAVKNAEAKNKYGALFATRNIRKEYLAICVGKPTLSEIQTQILRDPLKRKEMTIDIDPNKGKTAITHCEIITVKNPLSLVKLHPITGRTHQLRVHLKYAKSPILGDPVYGCPKMNKSYGCEKQLLHAHKLSFHRIHDNKLVTFMAPCPEDMKLICSKHLAYVL
ncbi:MAG: RluA family pseudouridine synthase [Victivallaceae bacterium]